jgi:hypothetical protein
MVGIGCGQCSFFREMADSHVKGTQTSPASGMSPHMYIDTYIYIYIYIVDFRLFLFPHSPGASLGSVGNQKASVSKHKSKHGCFLWHIWFIDIVAHTFLVLVHNATFVNPCSVDGIYEQRHVSSKMMGNCTLLLCNVSLVIMQAPAHICTGQVFLHLFTCVFVSACRHVWMCVYMCVRVRVCLCARAYAHSLIRSYVCSCVRV